MARIRTIKPEFFTSESICNISPLARLLFIALWCEADREGRLVWRPKTLKIRYLPTDKCDIDELADSLISEGMIIIYTVDDVEYCEIPTFLTHQVINNRERESTIPKRIDACVTRESGEKAEGRKEGKGREGKGKEGKGKEHASEVAFEEFWSIYPRKEGKAEAIKKWEKLNINQDVFDLIKNHLSKAYINTEPKFIPHASTYLNQSRWEDEPLTEGCLLSTLNYGEGGNF